MVLVWLRRQLLYLYWQFTHFLDCLRFFPLHFSSRWLERCINSLEKLTVIKEKMFLRSTTKPQLQSNHFSWTRTNTDNWALVCGWKETHLQVCTHISVYFTPWNRLKPDRTIALRKTQRHCCALSLCLLANGQCVLLDSVRQSSVRVYTAVQNDSVETNSQLLSLKPWLPLGVDWTHMFCCMQVVWRSFALSWIISFCLMCSEAMGSLFSGRLVFYD